MAEGERQIRGAHRSFRDAVTRAEVEAEAVLVARWWAIATEGQGDYRAIRDLLARRHPARWMPRAGTEHAGPEGGPIPVEVSERAREALLRRLDGMAERFNDPVVVPMASNGDTA